MQNHNYELLATAYANYILTFHIFLYECLEIIETLITDCLEQQKYLKLRKVYNFYNELIYRFNKNIIQELDDSIETKFSNLNQKEQTYLNKKRKLWVADIMKQIKKIRSNQQKIEIIVQNRLKSSGYKSFILKNIIKISNRRYRRKNKSIFKKSIILGEYFKKNPN